VQTTVVAAAAEDANPLQPPPPPPLKQDTKQAAMPNETCVEDASGVAAVAANGSSDGERGSGGSKNNKPERKYMLPSYYVFPSKGQVLNKAVKRRLDRPPVPKDSTCPPPPPSDV